MWEIAWHDEDALRFALPVSARIGTQDLRTRGLARVLGNNVPADFGTSREERLPAVPANAPYRPSLLQRDVTFAVPYDPKLARTQAASALTNIDPQRAVPDVSLTEDYGAGVAWSPARDLLDAVPDAPVFAVEVDSDRIATLRFGDGEHGRVPSAGATFVARYRTGNGPSGHIGADSLTVPLGYRAGRALPGAPAAGVGDDGLDAGEAVGYGMPPRSLVLGLTVRNPLPPAGGSAPDDVDAVRRAAPDAARVARSAVTADDYGDCASRIGGVRAARAATVFTGSWRTVRVYVQRASQRGVDAAFLRSVRDQLEPYRLANTDLLVAGPVYVVVDAHLELTIDPAFETERLRARVDGAIGALLGTEPYSFGDDVHASPFVAAAMSIPGVLDVRVLRLARAGTTGSTAQTASVAIGAHEIARVARVEITFTGTGGPA